MSSKPKEPKELLNKFLQGMKDLSSEKQAIFRPFDDLLKSIYNPGKLDEKTKVLISIGIAVYNRSEASIVYHVNQALKLGANEEEIIEAALVAVSSGGVASMSYCVTYVKDAIKALQ
ncbi:carboxymuconolactone decarboxylase family protein [Alkalibaculum sp. M08DMB]|uniref:Carboxymuconolactone decarboxylase family protein n=1 Tax=Alkalibaculum sporogenes TaxID=2655001 RepID=A0A6A7KCN1_9FIRM|nr:carboxymuconolactone decarboxylase family protein [Alkalibaculum sporogenes]MPW27112.1 carboxymuconolactone decarboxylase family protein [Alkalibaculum sporogenes]